MNAELEALRHLLDQWTTFREESSSCDLQAFAQWLLPPNQPDSINPASAYIEGKTRELSPGTFDHEQAAKAQLGYLLGRLYRFARNAIKEPFSRIGLYGMEEFGILALVDRLDKPSKKEIKEASLMEYSTVSDMVKRLTGKGYLKELKDPIDKRLTRHELTLKGRELLKASYLRLMDLQPPISGDLSSSEVEQLIRLLEKLNVFHTRTLTGMM